MTGMDAQVLLLMEPGAELGWAVLSDTLPSAGGERKYSCYCQSISLSWAFLLLINLHFTVSNQQINWLKYVSMTVLADIHNDETI